MSFRQRKICRLSKPLVRLIRPRREVFVFLVFLVLSGLFWLSTALNGYYDYEIDLPVVVNGMPANIIQTDSLDVVRVSVHDKGYTLLQYAQRKNLSSLSIDFQTFRKPNGRCAVSAVELHKLVTKRLQNSTSISSVKPDKIEFGFIEGVAKNVSVRLNGDFVPAKNYYLEHTEISPSHVTLYAPADEIDTIHFAVTERLNIEDFSDTVSQNVKIRAAARTKVVPAEVTVTLYPDVLTEEEVEVPVAAVNVPEGTILRTFPARVKVRFTVGASMYRNVNASQFKVQMDYNDIAIGAEKCRVRLAAAPKGVKSAALETDEVDYLIEN